MCVCVVSDLLHYTHTADIVITYHTLSISRKNEKCLSHRSCQRRQDEGHSTGCHSRGWSHDRGESQRNKFCQQSSCPRQPCAHLAAEEGPPRVDQGGGDRDQRSEETGHLAAVATRGELADWNGRERK